MVKNGFNASPSHNIQVAESVEYQPISGIVEELSTIEKDARETDRALRTIMARISIWQERRALPGPCRCETIN